MVGTSVMISPVAFGSVPADLLGPLAELLGIPKEGLALNVDQWDGYTDDRRELLTHLRDQRIENTVFLTGDIHMAFANDVPVKAATYPEDAPVATEFVVTSVTSDNLDDIINVAPDTLSTVAEAAVKRHQQPCAVARHGLARLRSARRRLRACAHGLLHPVRQGRPRRHRPRYAAPTAPSRAPSAWRRRTARSTPEPPADHHGHRTRAPPRPATGPGPRRGRRNRGLYTLSRKPSAVRQVRSAASAS